MLGIVGSLAFGEFGLAARALAALVEIAPVVVVVQKAVPADTGVGTAVLAPDLHSDFDFDSDSGFDFGLGLELLDLA